MTRPRRQALLIVALTPAVLALDLLAWVAWVALRLLPALLTAGALVAAYQLGRRGQLHGRAPKVIQGHAEDREVRHD